MVSANCPCCKKLIKPENINRQDKRASFQHILCPYCDAHITMSKRSQLWFIPMISMIPVCIICAVIDGNSDVDSFVEYASIGISFFGLLGLIATYSYEEVKQCS